MKTLLIVLLLSPVQAMAAASYLGTANQDVTVTAPLPAGTNNIGDVDVLSLPALPAGSNNIGTVSGSTVNIGGSLPAGSNNIGDVDVLTLPSIPAGGNTIGNIVLEDAGGEKATVTSGRLDVNATITSADVSVSTVGIRGSQGQVIASETQSQGISLDVVNTGREDLNGLSLVYKSSNSMVVGGALTLTGKANSVSLQAVGGECTYNLAGGESITLAKNTAEDFNFDYHATNLTVNLTAKDGGATCKVRMTGAN